MKKIMPGDLVCLQTDYLGYGYQQGDLGIVLKQCETNIFRVLFREDRSEYKSGYIYDRDFEVVDTSLRGEQEGWILQNT